MLFAFANAFGIAKMVIIEDSPDNLHFQPMNQTSKSTPAPAGAATPEKKALLEAFDDVLRRQAESRETELREAEARRRARSQARPIVWIGLAILLFIGAYLYIERPDWVFPAPAAPESLALKEASLRIAMANTAQHVERFRQRTGHLPATLAEAGAYTEGISYERTGTDSYRLLGENAGVRLALGSSERLAAFLGNSFEVITRRPR